jgi:hypothetical protein
MPRLAGQQREHFEDQLQAFVDGRRKNKFMFDVAKVLSPAMRTALAAHSENLNPKPVGGTPRGLVRAGKKIYEEGVPESNILLPVMVRTLKVVQTALAWQVNSVAA